MKKLGVLVLFLQCVCFSAVQAQGLQATVNRTDVPQGETFLLTLETDDDKSNSSPDLSVLEKDFTVYSVGNAYQSSYINGVTTHSRQWQIVLMPKNSGKIEIPAIKFGNQSSTPIILNVSPSQLQNQTGADKDADAPKFAVDASVDNKTPYVQQQINYTFKIYDSGGLQGDEPVVLDNGSNEWIIKNLGEPKVDVKVINGRQLREIEFNYALFPQKSGMLKTPRMAFNGYYLTRSTRGVGGFDDVFNNAFFNMGFSDMFASRNPVSLVPEEITVNVKPIPAANGNYWWLPASQVVLTSEWEDKNPEFRVGEAVSRAVYLKASGVIENQLPDIKFEPVSGAKQYPEKPIAMSSQKGDEIVSIKKFSTVLIPEQAGEIEIPAVRIDWYNIHAGKIEKAILPAQKIKVLPAFGGEQKINPEPTPKTEQTKPESVEKAQSTEKKSASPLNEKSWIWIPVAFILGLLSSYLLFARKSEKAGKSGINFFAGEIQKNARRGEVKQLQDNLLAWAKLVYDNQKITNLNDIVKCVETEELQKQLKEIDKMLYSSQQADFEAEVFIKAFKEESGHRKKTTRSQDILPKLYK